MVRSQESSKVNLVHPTEFGTAVVELFIERLRADDSVPGIPAFCPGESLQWLNNLRRKVKQSPTIGDAIREIQNSPYFRTYLDNRPVMIEQLRNNYPADATTIFRNASRLAIESMFSTVHSDPVCPLIVDPRIVPARAPRTTPDCLQCRKTFDLYELADQQSLLESHTYRVIFDDLKVSWHAIVLDRDDDFTWVIFFWYHREGDETTRAIRAGLENIAETLADRFHRARLARRDAFSDVDSDQRGLLVFNEQYTEIFRQNFTAETILSSLLPEERVPPTRSAIYHRIMLEHRRREQAKLELEWTVGPCFHPTEDSEKSVVRVSTRTYEADDECFIAGQHEVTLKELRIPYLARPSLWWKLEKLRRDSKLGQLLIKLGDAHRAKPVISLPKLPENLFAYFQSLEYPYGYYLEHLSAIARPVWDVDMVANRLQRYLPVPSGKVGRPPFTRSKLSADRIWTVTFHRREVGIIQAI